MMDIAIGGSFLDIPQQDVVLHSENFRFAGVLADPYSTDIEIPLTTHNRGLLDIYNELSRSGQMHGQYVNCVATIDGIPRDSLLSVREIHEETAVVTLYCSSLPSGLFDKSLREVLSDDANTIVDWAANNGYSNNRITTYGFNRYIRGDNVGDNAITNALCRPHPVVNVNYLLGQLSAALGVTILGNTAFEYLTIMASRKKVTPQQTVQYIYGVDSLYVTAGGQHITNDFSGVGDGKVQSFKFNRHCQASIFIKLTQTGNSGRTLAILRGVEGQTSIPVGSVSTTTQGEVATATLTTQTFNEGDILYFGFGTGADNEVVITYSDYTINDDDYDVDLVYDNHVNCTWFGVYTNLPDMKIRDLINSLCWVAGVKPEVVGNTVGWQTANKTVEVDAEIEGVYPVTTYLGQRNTIEWSNGKNTTTTSTIASVYLDKVKVLHKSLFAYYGNRNGRAVVPQYTISTDVEESGGSQVVKYTASFEEVQGVVLLRSIFTGNYAQLLSPQPLKTLGLQRLVSALEVQGVCEGDIGDADFINVDGRTYMLVSTDYTVESRITEFVALLVNPNALLQ